MRLPKLTRFTITHAETLHECPPRQLPESVSHAKPGLMIVSDLHLAGHQIPQITHLTALMLMLVWRCSYKYQHMLCLE